MEKLLKAARILLGIIFVIFGLNFFLHFIPMPAPKGEMATFMGGLFAAKYFFPLLGATQFLGGLTLLTGKFKNLGLVVLAPVILNIFLVHAFIDPVGLPMAIFVVVLFGASVYSQRSAYKELFKA